jgi:hypothetical protein
MTDNPTRDSLDIHPTAPWSPSATPALSSDPLPAISFSEAESRKAELFANEEWRTRYFAGDVEATREYNQIVHGLTTPPPAPTDERQATLEALRQHGPVFPAAAAEIETGRASTPADVQEAKDALQQFSNDAGWMERYKNGGRLEHAQINTINLILSRRIRDDPFAP